MDAELLTVILAAAVMSASSAGAADQAPNKIPPQIQRLMTCRATVDAEQRLACFDRETVAIEQAIGRRDLVMIDRARATAAKRSLFGFSVPDFGGLFGGNEDEVKQIEGVIAAVGSNADGGWIIRLVDGSTWSQTDDVAIGRLPKPGQKVIIRRATLGSFMLSVEGRPGIKVKRTR